MLTMRNDDAHLNERWVDMGEIWIPPVRGHGFEADVLIRDIWERTSEEEQAAEEPRQEAAEELRQQVPEEPVQEPPKQWIVRLLRMNSPEGETITIGSDDFTIGKSMTADYSVAGNPTISRIHARVFRDGNDWFLEDQGSRNHTYANGHRIDGPWRLQDRQLIRFANEDFLVMMEEVIG